MKLEKEIYISPQLDIIRFDTEDVIITSGNDPDDTPFISEQ